jgi:hypothetical protein
MHRQISLCLIVTCLIIPSLPSAAQAGDKTNATKTSLSKRKAKKANRNKDKAEKKNKTKSHEKDDKTSPHPKTPSATITGKRIFQAAGCSDCHKSPTFTTAKANPMSENHSRRMLIIESDGKTKTLDLRPHGALLKEAMKKLPPDTRKHIEHAIKNRSEGKTFSAPVKSKLPSTAPSRFHAKGVVIGPDGKAKHYEFNKEKATQFTRPTARYWHHKISPQDMHKKMEWLKQHSQSRSKSGTPPLVKRKPITSRYQPQHPTKPSVTRHRYQLHIEKPDSSKTTPDSTNRKLDLILKRLEQLENNIARIEKQLKH